VSEDFLAKLFSEASFEIPPRLPTIEEELMGLKMPSGIGPNLEGTDDNELHDYVRPLIHPDAIEYMKAFPDATVSDIFKLLGTGNLLTVQINVDRARPKTLTVLNQLLSVLTSKKKGWNTSKAPEYLSAWNSGVGKSSKSSTKTMMRRRTAAKIIQGVAPEQFQSPATEQEHDESVLECSRCPKFEECEYIQMYATKGRLCPPLEEMLKKQK
jgi:hypothetical protein